MSSCIASTGKGLEMNKADKIIACAASVLIAGVIILLTSTLQTKGFIENNCKETTLVDISGRAIFDCEGIDID